MYLGDLKVQPRKTRFRKWQVREVFEKGNCANDLSAHGRSSSQQQLFGLGLGPYTAKIQAQGFTELNCPDACLVSLFEQYVAQICADI